MSNRTFYASTYVVADGATRTWPFSFAGVNTGQESGVTPYLYPEDVKVQELYTDADGNRQTVQRAGVLNAPNQITIDGPAIIAGHEIRIYRETELRFPLVDYRDLQSVSEHDLDLANRQAVFIAQESRDAASANLLYDKQGHFNAGGRRIVNLAPGVDGRDAVNMEQHRRTIRVPDERGVPELPDAPNRAGKLLTFDSNGMPQLVFPGQGTALDLEMRLLRDGPGEGAWMSGYRRSSLPTTIATIQHMLDITAVHILEYSEYADKTNPARWDWAPAFNRALASGVSVNIGGEGVYWVSDRLVYTANDQVVFGNGAAIKTLGSGTKGTILYAKGLRGVKALGLTLVPGAVTGGLWTSGSAVLFDECTAGVISTNDVSGGRRGLSLVDSHDMLIDRNYIHDSLVHANPATATQFGADIGIYNSCSGITVVSNRCTRGNGQGIAVQTNGQAGHVMANILIANNRVSHQDAYGILIYSDGANSAGVNPDVFVDILVTSNSVTDITGKIPNPFDGSLSFGAGIYVQGAEGVTLGVNTVRRANLFTTSALLAPAGIGATNLSTITLSSNTVEECGRHGFILTDPLKKGRPGGVATLIGNVSRKNVEHGFFFNDFPEACLSTNTAEGNTRYGFFVRDQGTTQSRNFSFAGNTAARNGQNGITVANGDSVLTANIVNSNGAAGISIGSGVTLLAQNSVKGNAGRGIELSAGVVDAAMDTNLLDANRTQLYMMAPARGACSNIIRNTPSGGVDYAGDYGAETGIAGATPSVKNGRYFVKTDTVSISALSNPYTGQEITIRASAGQFILLNGGQIATDSGADVNVATGKSITLRYVAAAWRQSK